MGAFAEHRSIAMAVVRIKVGSRGVCRESICTCHVAWIPANLVLSSWPTREATFCLAVTASDQASIRRNTLSLLPASVPLPCNGGAVCAESVAVTGMVLCGMVGPLPSEGQHSRLHYLKNNYIGQLFLLVIAIVKGDMAGVASYYE